MVYYYKLNKITRKDIYPLLRINKLLDSLGNIAVFLILDIYLGFYQIEVDSKSCEKTAFVMKYGTYQYNRLSMSLCNSPATFQHLVDIIFAGSLRNYMVTYINNLNIYSKMNNDHFQYLRKVFKWIHLAGLLLNPEKCEFFKSLISFLGYVISADGITTDPAKIEKVTNFPKL